jgi:hypothetical protein
MRDDLAYTYHADRNPNRQYLDGVPLRDLTMRDVARLPEHLQAAIPLQPFYVAVEAAEAAPAEDAEREPAAAVATPEAVKAAQAKQPRPKAAK